MPPIDQIRESIEARIAEVNRQIASLEAARAALDGTSGRVASSPASAPRASAADDQRPTASGPKPRRRSRSRRTRSQGSVEVLLAGRLETLLGESEHGLSAMTIASRSNAAYGQVLELLRSLESTGQVRRTGIRRTSRWRVVTDEERIAERAAELEKLSRASAAP